MTDVAERIIYPVTITKIVPYVQVVDMMDMKQSAIHVADALEVANQLRLVPSVVAMDVFLVQHVKDMLT